MGPQSLKAGGSKKEAAPLTAIVIADSFDQRFAPILGSQCFGLLEVCNIPLIDFALTWLLRTKVDNVLLVATEKSARQLEPVEKCWQNAFEQFKLVASSDLNSVGDCIREVNKRELLPGDFLLVTNPATVAAGTLATQIATFRKRTSESPDNVMTLIYSHAENRDKAVICVERASRQLKLYHTADNVRQLDIDRDSYFPDSELRRDIVDCGIALCSKIIANQFADNFDFRHRDDVIREILSKDEVLGFRIHVDVLPDTEGAFCATDYDSLLTLSQLLLSQSVYPITPDRVISTNSRFFAPCPHDVYLEQTAETFGSLSSRNVPDAVETAVSVGRSCSFAQTASINNCSIGPSTTVGANSKLNRCLIGAECKIGANCELEDFVLGDRVHIPDGTVFRGNLVVGSDVVFPSLEEIPPLGAVCSRKANEDELENIVSRPAQQKGTFFWSMRNGHNFWRLGTRAKSSEGSDGDESGGTESDEDDELAMGIPDSAEQFYEEVLENMEQILHVESPQLKHLVVEINSSRLASNVNMDDASRNIFAAFLALPHPGGNNGEKFENLKKLVLKWRPLFENYYKTTEAQLKAKGPSQQKIEFEMKRKCQVQMLLAVEDHYERRKDAFGPKIVAKFVHFLYNDADVLDEDAIHKWFDTIASESPLKAALQPIIDWLEDDGDDESDDE